jgi:hypothetical protein
MGRITLNDTSLDAIMKMADGNSGALQAIILIIEKHKQIDPQALMGGIGALLSLDDHEIYGSSIYILFNDKCNRDVRRMLMLMRATQLGFFSHLKLKELSLDQMQRVTLTEDEFAELDQKVCEALTDFAKPTKGDD